MRIKFERTGGFAGMKISASFDLDELPEEQSKPLLELLDDADFDELPALIMPRTPGADQFTYKIEVDGRKGAHSVQTTDSAAPEKLRPLLETLNRLARSQAGKRS
jgi:hypothetical protein